MVLGGTALTALVAGNILPYSWSTSFCFIFGAILSGTDPIAVQSLLASAGAPHRLNMHISGESLLNDGSVVVLFNIFSSLFFYELNIPAGFGTFSVGEGFVYFFRLALGGCAIGFAFGLGTVMMLKMLNRRLSEEENVVQVVLTVSSAYLVSRKLSLLLLVHLDDKSSLIASFTGLLYIRDLMPLFGYYGDNRMWNYSQSPGRDLYQRPCPNFALLASDSRALEHFALCPRWFTVGRSAE